MTIVKAVPEALLVHILREEYLKGEVQKSRRLTTMAICTTKGQGASERCCWNGAFQIGRLFFQVIGKSAVCGIIKVAVHGATVFYALLDLEGP